VANDVIQNQLKAGIAAAKAGNKALARQLLEQVLEKDENNETAWMWMAMVVDTPRDKRVCLEQVLEINPNNQRAREALERLQPGSATAKAAPSAPRQTARAAADELRSAPPPASRPVRNPASRMPSAQRRPQSRLLTPPFLLGMAAAAGMILIGILLLTGQTPASVSTPTPVVITGTAAQAAVKPTDNGTTPPTLPPVNVTLVTLEPPAPLPTVTPSLTFTPAIETSPAPTLPAVSGYTLAFVGEGRAGAKQAIYTIKGDGSEEKLLISEGTATSDFALSTDKHIAYVSSVDGIPQLFVANADGRNSKAITTLQGKNLVHPSWSPNADRITFASDDTGDSEIYIVDADGSNLTRITDNNVEDRDPAWSPNNDIIVYVSDPTGKHSLQLFEYNLSSKKAQQSTDSSGSNYSPAWNPDGNQLAFISTRDRYPNIYVMEMRGLVRSPQLVTYSNLTATYRDPNWSPDGRYILFASDRDGANIFNLYMMTPDGKVLSKITDNKEGRNSYRGWVIQ
jgi:Tol biopolymer transport system component